jgi:hypothetical protein
LGELGAERDGRGHLLARLLVVVVLQGIKVKLGKHSLIAYSGGT